MMFIKLTLTNGRGTVLINVAEIQAISGLKEKTEIYLKGQREGKCFAVTETIREIEDKMEKFNNFDIEKWC